MNDNTPYQAPTSEIIDHTNMEYADVQVFSTTQRIGRVRYLAYNFIATFVASFFIGIVAAIFIPLAASASTPGDVTPLTVIILFILYLVPFVISVIISRRRLHDLGNSGWMALLLLVPIANLIFVLYLIFAPGTKGENKYGLQPTPNTALTWIGGLVGPILLIILIAAAIPAYDDYVERAKATQASS